jgi:hypothetical protein
MVSEVSSRVVVSLRRKSLRRKSLRSEPWKSLGSVSRESEP